MNFNGCHCPHCKADMSETTVPQCPLCNRHLDVDELYAKRKYKGTIVLPAGLRRYGLPVLFILAGCIYFLATGGGGRWIGLGLGYLFLSLFFDPFDH